MAVGTMFTGGSVAFAVEPVPQTVSFVDDFSGYTTETAPINTTTYPTIKSVQYNQTSAGMGASKLIAKKAATDTSPAAEWRTPNNGDGYGYGVVDTVNGCMWARSSTNAVHEANLSFPATNLKSVEEINVKYTSADTESSSTGIHLFNNKAEDTYLRFFTVPRLRGSGDHSTPGYDTYLKGVAGNSNIAYVALVKGGEVSLLALSTGSSNWKNTSMTSNGCNVNFEWNITIDGGKISWTVKEYNKGSTTLRNSWTGSITEGATVTRLNKDDATAQTVTIPKLSESDYAYPVSLIGNTSRQNYNSTSLAPSKAATKYTYVALKATVEKDADPIIKDEVADYAENNAKEATRLRDLGSGSTIATHTDGFKWTVPAYTGPESTVKMDTVSNEINIISFYNQSQPINLEPIDGQIKGINKINAVIDAGAEAFGIRFFVNEAEDTYYVLNMNGHDEYYDSTLGNKRMPSFAVVSSGTATVLNQITAYDTSKSTDVWGNSGTLDYAGYQIGSGVRKTRYEFDVEVEGTTINYSIKEYIISSGELFRTFSGTYEADESIINNAKYAVAPYSRGESENVNARIKSVKLWADYMTYTDKAEGENVLKIMPYEYKNTRYITAVGATYGGDYSTFSDAEVGVINKSDAPNGVAKWSFPKSSGNRQKMFFLDGALENVKPLEKAVALDK